MYVFVSTFFYHDRLIHPTGLRTLLSQVLLLPKQWLVFLKNVKALLANNTPQSIVSTAQAFTTISAFITFGALCFYLNPASHLEIKPCVESQFIQDFLLIGYT